MSTQARGQTGASGADVERRRSPRVAVSSRIQAHVGPLSVPVTLLNLSRDGVQMQSPVNYPVGAIHDIRFSVHDREPIMLRARTVHVMRASAGEVASYVVGVTFLDRGVTTCEEAIESLVQELGSASE